MSEIKIEKGFPVPITKERNKNRFTEILELMAPGDSFAVPAGKMNNLRYSISKFIERKHPEWMFTSRKLNSDGSGRVWRVK